MSTPIRVTSRPGRHPRPYLLISKTAPRINCTPLINLKLIPTYVRFHMVGVVEYFWRRFALSDAAARWEVFHFGPPPATFQFAPYIPFQGSRTDRRSFPYRVSIVTPSPLVFTTSLPILPMWDIRRKEVDICPSFLIPAERPLKKNPKILSLNSLDTQFALFLYSSRPKASSYQLVSGG
jgi:hypothetical protein